MEQPAVGPHCRWQVSSPRPLAVVCQMRRRRAVRSPHIRTKHSWAFYPGGPWGSQEGRDNRQRTFRDDMLSPRKSASFKLLQGETPMPFYAKDDVRIHYEEVGSGFPLMIIPGGGLNSTVAGLANHPFNPMEEFQGEYRVIAADLRNANGGESSGPLEIDRPWDAYADDHLGLMDHLGIGECMVLGFCIGGPFIWNLLQRAPERIVAAVLAQPSGFRPEMPDLFYPNNMKGWGPE